MRGPARTATVTRAAALAGALTVLGGLQAAGPASADVAGAAAASGDQQTSNRQGAQGQATVLHGAFPEPTLKRWKERSFVGHTRYALVEDDGIRVLQGQTTGHASVLYRERSIDLERTPMLHWSWKIHDTYGMNIDEQSRKGDDFPARVYVVVKTGFLPWETLALNYVWSSSTPAGTIWRNPYTDKAGMLAVQSGNRNAGRWVSETRDVEADFRAVFGEDIDAIDGYAIMVDGDDSGASGLAWFGNLEFAARP